MFEPIAGSWGVAHSSLQWGKHQRRGTWVCHSSTGRAPSIKLVIPLNRPSSMYNNTCQETPSCPHSPLSRFPGRSEDRFMMGGPPCPEWPLARIQQTYFIPRSLSQDSISAMYVNSGIIPTAKSQPCHLSLSGRHHILFPIKWCSHFP